MQNVVKTFVEVRDKNSCEVQCKISSQNKNLFNVIFLTMMRLVLVYENGSKQNSSVSFFFVKGQVTRPSS